MVHSMLPKVQYKILPWAKIHFFKKRLTKRQPSWILHDVQDILKVNVLEH